MQKLYKGELILITFDKISSFRKLFWHVTGYQESKGPGLFGIYLGIGLCDIDKKWYAAEGNLWGFPAR